jgi:putative transposase
LQKYSPPQEGLLAYLKEDCRAETPWKSLAHSRWECKYPGVFILKYRGKALCGESRESLGAISHELARPKEDRIVEGHLWADPVSMCGEIPPQHAMASVIGFLKGKSSLAIARQLGGKLKNCTGEHFWARGYAVSFDLPPTPVPHYPLKGVVKRVDWHIR